MELDYLIEAIKIVVHGQLKDNHDDTLIEKLVSLVERNVTEGVLSFKEQLKLLSALNEMIDIDHPEGTCLRLMAAILKSENIFRSAEDIAYTALTSFIAASRTVSSKSDLSVQSALVLSLSNLSMMSNVDWPGSQGDHFLMDTQSFPEKVVELMKNSSSYFVRHESEKLLIQMITLNQTNLENSNDKLRLELLKMANDPTEDNLNFLKQLTTKTAVIRTLLRLDFREIVYSHFISMIEEKSPDQSRIITCLEVLASLVPRQLMVDTVISSLVKLNMLKALVVFTSVLMRSDRDHMNKWLLFSLYSLVCKSESRGDISSQIMISLRERTFVEKLATNAVILTVLSKIPIVLNNLDEKWSLLREALQIFLTEKLKDKSRLNQNRKVISEAISCLDKMTKEEICIQEVISTVIELIPLSSGHHLVHLLTICRDFYSTPTRLEHVGFAPLVQVLTNLLNEQMLSTCNDEQIELYGDQSPSSEALEVIIQVVAALSHSPSISNHKELILAFKKIYDLKCDEQEMKTAAVPVLFSLNFEMSSEDLTSTFEWQQHHDVIQLLSSYLQCSDASLLRAKVIETFLDKSNSQRMYFLVTHRPDILFGNLIRSLIQCLITCVDTETQRSIVELWITLFQYPNELTIQKLFNSGLLDVLMFIIENESGTFCRSLRVDTSELVIIVKMAVKKLSEDGKSLIDVLKDVLPPEDFQKCSPASYELPAPIPAFEKREKIEDLFNNSINQPTMDMIQELNQRLNGSSCVNDEDHVPAKKSKNFNIIHPLDDLIVFYTNPSNKMVEDEEVEEDTGIIDDIISARVQSNMASMDCY